MRLIAFASLLASLALIGLVAFGGISRPTFELSYTADCKNTAPWQSNLTAEGFDIRATQVDNLSLSEQRAMMIAPAPMRDCMMGRVAGYHVIGDIPANDIITLLRRKPADVIALARDDQTRETVAIHHDGSIERREVTQ
ncbi:DUF411 domain-containing protein [Thalassospira alkalitolerans]|uniref:Uncharacterized protein n=1 Tax=Thalassospira alkalitolerans TaxID=1293890 RepID=A0A1Y2LBF8_9PROT|nr:DUF411 domain-containing protein [Thalassospira alkalitolerans]OSQ48005.1 hypothetical protein TALK_10415 [Thalassospira alkalitolerans]|tara:strand:+ start:74759 stop:75175 length:417 start_codon:yes stop_codon:yes gene_type:complete